MCRWAMYFMFPTPHNADEEPGVNWIIFRKNVYGCRFVHRVHHDYMVKVLAQHEVERRIGVV